VRAVRSILNFLYIAQFPVQSEETLNLLISSLSTFHENKDVFEELGIRDGFNIPKLHSMQHYAELIRNYGTTDNYNTEYTERLHIDLAKDAYEPIQLLFYRSCRLIHCHQIPHVSALALVNIGCTS